MKKFKYEQLKHYLQTSSKEVIVLDFDEINTIIDSELPPCLSGIGYNKKLLWNNSVGNYATRSWLEAGYVFESCSKENKNVTFIKNDLEANRYLVTNKTNER